MALCQGRRRRYQVDHPDIHVRRIGGMDVIEAAVAGRGPSGRTPITNAVSRARPGARRTGYAARFRLIGVHTVSCRTVTDVDDALTSAADADGQHYDDSDTAPSKPPGCPGTARRPWLGSSASAPMTGAG